MITKQTQQFTKLVFSNTDRKSAFINTLFNKDNTRITEFKIDLKTDSSYIFKIKLDKNLKHVVFELDAWESFSLLATDLFEIKNHDKCKTEKRWFSSKTSSTPIDVLEISDKYIFGKNGKAYPITKCYECVEKDDSPFFKYNIDVKKDSITLNKHKFKLSEVLELINVLEEIGEFLK